MQERQSELEKKEKEIICKELECQRMSDSDGECEKSNRRYGKDIKIYIVGEEHTE